MTENHSSRPKAWPQIMGALAAGMAAMLQGPCFAYPTRALPQLLNESDPNIRLTSSEASWFASMHMLCAVAFCPLGGVAANLLGRRLCLISFSLLLICGWIMIAFSWNIPILFIGRLITVSCAGCLTVSIGVYISETAHPNIRSSLAVFQTLFLAMGFLIVLGPGYLMSDWRALTWICTVPGMILILLFMFLPDTPYHLVEKNQTDKARESLQFFRGKDYDVTRELDEIIRCHQKKVQALKSSSWTNVFRRMASPAFGRPFLCIGVLRLITQLGESSNLIIYMISIFEESKSTSIDPKLAPVITGTLQVIATAISSVIIRKTSPRIHYISCMAVVVIGDLTLATFLMVKSRQFVSADVLDSISWLPLVAVMCILTAQSLGVMPLTHMLLAELFPSDIRTVSIGLTQSVSFGLGAVNIKLFPSLTQAVDYFGAFYIYACVQFVATLWAFFTIPDNRGVSLVKVEENFENGKDFQLNAKNTSQEKESI